MNKEELNLSMKDKELPLPEIEEEIQNFNSKKKFENILEVNYWQKEHMLSVKNLSAKIIIRYLQPK